MKNINLNETIYDKLIIQAKEAKELGLNKLAEDVLSAMSPLPRDVTEVVTYSAAELESDTHKKLWKIAMEFIKFHDVESVDIQKIDDTLRNLSHIVRNSIEQSIDSNYVGPLEPKVFGQSK